MSGRIKERRYEGKDASGQGFVLSVRRSDDGTFAVRFGYSDKGGVEPTNVIVWLTEEQVRTFAGVMLDAVGRDGE